MRKVEPAGGVPAMVEVLPGRARPLPRGPRSSIDRRSEPRAGREASRFDSVRASAPALGLAVLYAGAGFVASGGQRPILDADVVQLVTGSAMLAAAGMLLRRVRAGSQAAETRTWTALVRVCTAPGFAATVLTACAVWWPLGSVAGYFKIQIPRLVPFYLDPLLVRLDALLHLGVQPGVRLIESIPESAVRLIDFAYGPLWAGVAFIVPYTIALFATGPFRLRVVLSFMLTWIVIGNVFALVMSSAGPCYFGAVYGLEDPFAPLLQRLNALHEQQPLFAVHGHRILWAGYVGEVRALGISAMPSVHVAVATLVLLAAFRYHVLLRIAAATFFATIVVGSVILGWHYAVDAYAAIALAGILWWATGRFTRWWCPAEPGQART